MLPGPDEVHELAADRRADDEQLLPAVVQDQVNPLPRLQPCRRANASLTITSLSPPIA